MTISVSESDAEDQANATRPAALTQLFLCSPFVAPPDDSNNVHFWPCHTKKNQQWFIDDKHRLHSRESGQCVDIDPDGKNLRMKKCSDDDSQRFIYAASFVTATSPVAPYSDLSKCWSIDPGTKNLVSAILLVFKGR